MVNITRYLQSALKEANKATGNMKHGAVTFSHKDIISSGHNDTRPVRFNGVNMNSLHAEQSCFKGTLFEQQSRFLRD